MFEHQLIDRAVADRRHIVLPEGDDDRVLQAADIVLRRRRRRPDDPRRARGTIQHARGGCSGVDISAATAAQPDRPGAARAVRGRSTTSAASTRASTSSGPATSSSTSSYFGTMMVELGLADGMVSGAAHTTAHTIRPALEVVATQPGRLGRLVGVLHVPARPGAGLRRLRGQPRPHGRAARRHRDLVGAHRGGVRDRAPGRDAVLLDRRLRHRRRRREGRAGDRAGAGARRPTCSVEGPIQYDAAIDAAVARDQAAGLHGRRAGDRVRLPGPQHRQQHLQGRAALAPARVAVGPVLQGLRKPVNDLSRGATVRDIVNTVAITAIQAQARGRREARCSDVPAYVLVVNAGSSSLKYSLVDGETGEAPRSGLGRADRRATRTSASTSTRRRASTPSERPFATFEDALRRALEAFDEHGPALGDVDLVAVGHRVVHGGDAVRDADADRRRRWSRRRATWCRWRRCTTRPTSRGIAGRPRALPRRAAGRGVRHRVPPDAARRTPTPTPCRCRGARSTGVRRYGFHGTSHAYVSPRGRRAARHGRSRTPTSIVLHLGNGASRRRGPRRPVASTPRWA